MSWQDVQGFYVEPDEEEYQCPCGCEDKVENCVYASICPQCSKKFYGNGYARRDQLCPECRPTQREADMSCACPLDEFGMYQMPALPDGTCPTCRKPYR